MTDEWLQGQRDGGSVSGWEAWSVFVRLGTMPDGSVAPIGLRIEPRDDYEGSIRDQRITLDRLRRFPIGVATAQARFVEAMAKIPTTEAGTEAESEEWTWDNLPAHMENFTGSQEEWDAIQRLLDLADAKFAATDQAIAKIRANAKTDLHDRLREMYREAGMTERQTDLQMAADYYRMALRDPEVVSRRRFVAEAMGVSLTTADRMLRSAREAEYLAPYDGPQGKHGKKKGRDT